MYAYILNAFLFLIYYPILINIKFCTSM